MHLKKNGLLEFADKNRLQWYDHIKKAIMELRGLEKYTGHPK
jgi:hypothetical protein